VKAAEEAVQTALVQYRGGVVDFTRVTQVEQNLVTQQDTLAQAQGEIVTGLIQVYKALGGGWQIRETGCDSPPVDRAEPVATLGRPEKSLPAPRPAPEPKTSPKAEKLAPVFHIRLGAARTDDE
jgi:hypothetical protein